MMKQKIIFLLMIMMITKSVTNRLAAQVYYTKNGSISFYSKASMEDIKADNNQVISLVNTQTGEIKFSALNNAFHFPKAMMEEHFNSDYIQSDKYPSSTFKGTITDISKVDVTKDGSYTVTVQGDLGLHGVTKNITTPATFTVKYGKLSGTCTFKILLKDYDIKIPSVVVNNIAESIAITVSCDYQKK